MYDQDRRDGNSLILVHPMKASVQQIWACWSQPKLLDQWFCPKPWQYHCDILELKAGGNFTGSMTGPNGEHNHNAGIILEAIPEKKIVFTNMFTAGWKPQPTGFGMVAVVDLVARADGGTDYLAACHHWDETSCNTHEQMGFFAGWHAAGEQLDALAQSL